MTTHPRRAVVTGATGLIGEQIARGLAETGAEVVLVGRSPERLAETRERLLAGVPGAVVETEQADFGLVREVGALTAHLAAGPPPDVVISNAAVIPPLGARTDEGLLRILAVNHLAPYVLLPGLAEALGPRPARFVVVGADPTYLASAPVDLDDLDSAEPRNGEDPALAPMRAYGETKNMNAMFVYSLARRLEGTGITVNGAHPGVIPGSRLADEVPDMTRALAAAFDVDAMATGGPEQGADTPVWLATSPEVEGVSGRFFVDRRAVPTADHTTDPQRCERLWRLSADLVGRAA